MNTEPKSPTLQIKKYPNRRYYDATRSQHVTLQDVHDQVVAGSDVVVTDSRTGEDITNVILLQILLEKDQPKLDLFPSWFLHQFIRSNRQVLRTSMERFFGPFMEVFAQTQRQFDTYFRDAMRGQMVTPMDWANSMMRAFSGGTQGAPGPSVASGSTAGMEANGHAAPSDVDSPSPSAETLDELREQVATLTRRIESLNSSADNQPSDPTSRPA